MKKRKKKKVLQEKRKLKKVQSARNQLQKKEKAARKGKPTYLRMIKKSLSTGDEMEYFSFFAICNYIEENYPITENFKRYVKAALKRGLEDGTFKKHKASFRLSAKALKRKAPRRSRSKSPRKEGEAKKKRVVEKEKPKAKKAVPKEASKKRGREEEAEKPKPKKKESFERKRRGRTSCKKEKRSNPCKTS